MKNRGKKDEIIRFVLESPPAENQKLARFMAGIRTEAPAQGKAGEGEAAGVRDRTPKPGAGGRTGD
jgi:hypothetical protein